MEKTLHFILCALAVVYSARASSSTNTCGDEGCDASPDYDVGGELDRLADNVPNVSLFQRRALYDLSEEDAEDDTEAEGTDQLVTTGCEKKCQKKVDKFKAKGDKFKGIQKACKKRLLC
jgi:hypothetical protein